MLKTLPIFKGWIVDARLKEFREENWRYQLKNFGDINTVPFDSENGDRILTEYIKTLDAASEEFKEISQAVI